MVLVFIAVKRMHSNRSYAICPPQPCVYEVFMKPLPGGADARRNLNVRIEDEGGVDISAPIQDFSELDMLPEYPSTSEPN